jgi:hypothetical protein
LNLRSFRLSSERSIFLLLGTTICQALSYAGHAEINGAVDDLRKEPGHAAFFAKHVFASA